MENHEDKISFLKELEESLKLNEITYAEYIHTRDWLDFSEVDFKTLSIKEAVLLSSIWGENNLIKKDQGDIRLLFKYNDWEVYSLDNKTAYEYESGILQHCLWTYNFTKDKIYSIRRNGVPTYTVEVILERITQVFGRKNSFIKRKDAEDIFYIIKHFFFQKKIAESVNDRMIESSGFLKLELEHFNIFKNHFSKLKYLNFDDETFYVNKNNVVKIKKQFKKEELNLSLKESLLRFLCGENKINLWDNFYLHKLFGDEEFNEILLGKGIIIKDPFWSWFLRRNIPIMKETLKIQKAIIYGEVFRLEEKLDLELVLKSLEKVIKCNGIKPLELEKNIELLFDNNEIMYFDKIELYNFLRISLIGSCRVLKEIFENMEVEDELNPYFPPNEKTSASACNLINLVLVGRYLDILEGHIENDNKIFVKRILSKIKFHEVNSMDVKRLNKIKEEINLL